jgi:hypothetical protein
VKEGNKSKKNHGKVQGSPHSIAGIFRLNFAQNGRNKAISKSHTLPANAKANGTRAAVIESF